MPEILSTKPLPQACIVAAGAHGINVTAKAFIDIRPLVKDTIVSGIIVFTSTKAVCLVKIENNSRIYCLNGATLQAVKKHHHDIPVAGTASNARELAERIIADKVTAPVTFVCGNIRRHELPDLLRVHHTDVTEIIAYETMETPVAVEQVYDGILFQSPSSVRSFFSLNTLPASTVCFAIGPTTATALEGATSNRIVTSDAPVVERLIQTVISYFDNINYNE